MKNMNECNGGYEVEAKVKELIEAGKYAFITVPEWYVQYDNNELKELTQEQEEEYHSINDTWYFTDSPYYEDGEWRALVVPQRDDFKYDWD